MPVTIDIKKDIFYKKGIEQEEYRKAIATVRNCFAKNVSPENAAFFANLSLEEVEKIYKELEEGKK